MNVKVEVYKRIANKVKTEYENIQRKISQNKWEFKKLTAEQTKLKRERVEMQKIYNDFFKRAKKEKHGDN